MEETVHTRTMLPLKLAWAWTAWKVQGHTIKGKIVLHLGKKEAESGVTYVSFSRDTIFSNIRIYDGVSKNRLTSKIRNHAK